jgi:hypothetical protein
MNPRVVKAIPLENYELKLLFSNNEERIFDVKPYLDDKFWSRLKNEGLFKLVEVNGGSITWLNEDIDFCPDEVYENSVPYTSFK